MSGEISTEEVLANAARIVEEMLDEQELARADMAVVRELYRELQHISLRLAFIEALTYHNGSIH